MLNVYGEALLGTPPPDDTMAPSYRRWSVRHRVAQRYVHLLESAGRDDEAERVKAFIQSP